MALITSLWAQPEPALRSMGLGLGRSHRRASLAGLALALTMLTAACGASHKSSAAPPSTGRPAATTSVPATTAPGGGSTTGAAQAAITKAWSAFFNGNTPAAEKISLLQNGQAFAQVIDAQAGSGLAKTASASVSAVRLISPTAATVTYTILLSGKPALADQTGQAVLVGGTWKVASASFCGLLALEGSKPPACSSTAG
ncbi:MAG: hypothetical protein ACYC1D_15990 [Acidimicrobiales bacterium]